MNNTLVNYFPVQFTKHANLAIFPSRLRPAPSSPRSPSRSSRRRSTDWRMNLLPNRRSTRLSLRNSRWPLPRCLDIKLLFFCHLVLPRFSTSLFIFWNVWTIVIFTLTWKPTIKSILIMKKYQSTDEEMKYIENNIQLFLRIQNNKN